MLFPIFEKELHLFQHAVGVRTASERLQARMWRTCSANTRLIPSMGADRCWAVVVPNLPRASWVSTSLSCSNYA